MSQTLDSVNVSTQPANPSLPQASNLNVTVTDGKASPSEAQQFPAKNDLSRLSDYEYFNHLLMGEHFEAFAVRIDNNAYSANYGKLRYVAVNFAGLISKVGADMLFSEPLGIKAPDEGDQDWLDAFADDNKMSQQLYEAAIDASALGDTCFKLRVDKRHPNDKEMTVILEEFSPSIYFPQLDGFNVRALPNQIILQWTFKVGDKKYLRQEIHEPGTITDKVFEMKGTTIGDAVDLSILGIEGLSGTSQITDTHIDRYLVFHIPNWKTGNRHFGISDYYDLDKLFYAIDNRLTKIDNILDKHSDPILMVPDGVLDEDGNVERSKLNMLEVPEGNGAKQKPEYIVWNANLEAAFTQIDKLIDFFMMTAEITPDILGMGQGMNDSGRALKFKLMRTIAKAQRKKLYFDGVIKEILYTAQLLAKANNIGVGPDFVRLKGEPQQVELKWQDGLPIDDYEQVDTEIKKIDAGIQSKKDAIMNLDDVDEKAAEEKLDEIDEENPISVKPENLLPTSVTGNVTPAGQPSKPPEKPETNTPPVAK